MQQNKTIIIILVILLALICIVSVAVSYFSVKDLAFNVRATSVEKNEESEIKVDEPVNLVVDNSFGKVDIVARETSEIKIEAHYTSYGLTQDIALKNMEKVSLETTHEGPNVTVMVIYPNLQGIEKTDVSVDLTMVVPVETSPQVSLKFGDLSLKGTHGKTDLNNKFGTIEVSGVEGGAFTVISSNGNITIERVDVDDEPITIENKFGSVELINSSGGEITVDNDNGSISLNRVNSKKPLTVRSKFGDVNIRKGETGTLSIDQENGRIDVSGVKVNGSLVMNGAFGDIELQDVLAASYEINSRNGSIVVSGMSGKIVSTNDFGSITINEGEKAILFLETKNGSIEYSGSLGVGPHEISTSFGSVNLDIPSDTKTDVLLDTDMGKITTDFDITVQGVMDKNHMSGKINGGGKLLKITSNNGDITLTEYKEK